MKNLKKEDGNFQGEKHNGYQVMYDNLKRGEDGVTEVAQFIKERLSAEEEYAKLLGKGINKVAVPLSISSIHKYPGLVIPLQRILSRDGVVLDESHFRDNYGCPDDDGQESSGRGRHLWKDGIFRIYIGRF